MEYKRFGGKLLVRIDKDEEIGETNLILGDKDEQCKGKTGAVLRETAVLTGAVAIIAAGVFFFWCRAIHPSAAFPALASCCPILCRCPCRSLR